jgi:hypothetical protein
MSGKINLEIEIVRKKLDRYLVNKYQKLVCCVSQGQRQSQNDLNPQKYYHFTSGTQIHLSYSCSVEEIPKIILNIFTIDGSLTIYIGSCQISPLFYSQEEIKISPILDSNESRIGKFYYSTSITKIYQDEHPTKQNPTKNRDRGPHFYERNKLESLKSFRFQHLGRRINWDRIRSLNLERFNFECLSSFLIDHSPAPQSD